MIKLKWTQRINKDLGEFSEKENDYFMKTCIDHGIGYQGVFL